MHDCPTCRVPLHGYEEVCPSCGTRQHVRRSYSGLLKGQQKPTVNIAPFIIGIIILGICGFALAKSSWIFKVMERGPVKEDPLDKISWLEARQMLYNKIDEGLKANGAKGDYTWTTTDGNKVDINAQAPVELTINTELSDPNLRRQIIDPAKDLMHKAQVPSLVMNDAKSYATWTYTVQIPSPQQSGQGGQPDAPQGAAQE